MRYIVFACFVATHHGFGQFVLPNMSTYLHFSRSNLKNNIVSRGSSGKMRACAPNDLTQKVPSWWIVHVCMQYSNRRLCFRLCCAGAQTKFGLFAPACPPQLWGSGTKRAVKEYLLHICSVP